MSQASFVHLRLHSEYSITDGMIRIDEAVGVAKEDGMPALGLSDLSNFSGLVKFYETVRGKGLKPVAGVDLFITNDADRDRPYRLLVLCQSTEGYLRLCRLLSRAYLSNQYHDRAELRREWLHEEGTDGLIALSGAHLGDVGCALTAGNTAQARQFAQEWAVLFGNRYYIEVQRAGFLDEELYINAATHLAAELDLPVVATHPIQFLSAADFKAHEARVCIAEGYVINDKRRERAFTEQQYFKTQAEMAELFADLPEALQNSVEIARRCNLTLVLGKPRLPDFPTPNGVSLDDFLLSESERGLTQRMSFLYPDEAQRQAKWPQYHERLLFEINTIIKMGFPGYFLIVADFIRWAKAYRSDAFPNGVPVGPGRGSGAGSLVAYCLLITDLDPLRYELLFERFLNPERVSMPDFDVDFCQDGRELVIDYVKHKYGAACVSQIATFGTMASKAVIRDVGRVMEFPYGLCDRLSKAIPVEGVKPVSLKKAREMEPEINAIAESEEGVPELLELAMRLEDLTRNIGMHAGGVVIAPGKLTDFCPVYCADGGASVISQFDKDDVEAIGLVKFDFLGLRTLTIIDWAVRHIHRLEKRGLATQVEKGEESATALLKGEGETTAALPCPFPLVPSPFSIDAIPLDDKPTYDKIFKTANTTAVFQFESRGMKDTLVKARPDCLEDLIALNALYRPGPMDFIPDYINCKHGKQNVVIPHPCLEKVVGTTYGIMVYQEQVMQAAQVVAGYTLGGADMLRRAMGKKKPEEMAQQRGIFVAGAEKNNIDEKKANEIFDTMEKFAGYGFNKSHAAAYSLVAYQTAYLKCHYPAAFMASTMTSEMVNTDKVSFFYQDTLQQGLRILPPDINAPVFRFQPVDEMTVAYGLGAIKGTGEAAIDGIVKARETGPFKDLFDFCRRVDKRVVNRRTIETLIRAGAFDSIDDHRASLMASVDAAMASADQQARSANQVSLFGDDEADAVLIEQQADVPRWSLREQLAHEKSSLGMYLGGHPYQEYQSELANFIKVKLADLTPAFVGKTSGGGGYGQAARRGVQVRLAGIVSGLRLQQTRRGRMAVITLDDGGAQTEMTVFNEEYEKSRPWIVEDELLVVEGKASLDEYSGNIRVSGEALFSFAQARSRFAQHLTLNCNSSIAVEKLVEILTPWREGECKVLINYNNVDAACQLALGESWQVTLTDELLADLRTVLRPENVKIVYA
jgi:DNA polymerase-3 subunit alpha